MTAVVYEPAWLYPKQYDAVFDPARYSLIEASTKSGKTWGCIVWLTEKTMQGGRGMNYWWVAPIYAQAKIAFRRLKDALPSSVFSSNEGENTITLANGAVIWFKGSDNADSLFGEDVHACVVDEASRVKEDAWNAIRTTITATEAPVRLIGNVRGRQNWFYRMARKAEAGEPNMAYHRIIAADAVAAGIISGAEVEDARRQLPEMVFRELYLAEASDAGGNPFGLSAIRACVTTMSSDEPVVWGWDLAKSVDWTVGIGLDGHKQVCRLERFQMPWQETINQIHQLTGRTRSLVDSTGVGDPILEALQRKGGVYQGFKFTSPSKQQLMEGLAVAIQRGEVGFPDGPIVLELEGYEYVYTQVGVRYEAVAGMHDDCVCALALAVHHHIGSTHRKPQRIQHRGSRVLKGW